jgi:hypothetical protein
VPELTGEVPPNEFDGVVKLVGATGLVAEDLLAGLVARPLAVGLAAPVGLAT